MKEISIKAPGRICLFGEHQDYLGYPVIAYAIDRYIYLEAKENGSEYFHIQMPDLNEERSIGIHEQFPELQKRDYFTSGLRLLRRNGVIPNKGYDINISGDIPINSGLSSSSALCAAWVSFLIKAFSKEQVTESELAKLVYQTEVTEHGEPGGNMDQFSIVYGGLVKIETKDPFRVERLYDPEITMLIADSGVQKNTLDLLKRTKKKSLMALDRMQELNPELVLSTIKFSEVENNVHKLSPEFRSYFIGAIRGHDITRSATHLLQKRESGLVPKLADLMNEHQDLLHFNLNVSLPELDHLIASALSAGALSSKLVGSGGGGCVVVWLDKEKENIIRALDQAGAVNVFETRSSIGAFELNFS